MKDSTITRLIYFLKKENSTNLLPIIEKIIDNKRINIEEGLSLFNTNSLALLSCLATIVRQKKNGNNVYYIKNVHIEPTNICAFNCKFCSYSQSKKQWDLTLEEIIEKIKTISNDITEIHITGGVHPEKDLNYYINLALEIKKSFKNIHLKAYSVVELDYVFKKEKINYKKGIQLLKDAGVDSIPGGGAEIFDDNLRAILCPKKISSDDWLKLHKIAHKQGLTSNATMLYGHIEKYEHRIYHLDKLRNLQDETMGFNSFIPLKFRNTNNKMYKIPEVPLIEDLKNFAVSRIFLDNFPHIKAYWPSIGIENAILAMSFGADDIDGTIDDSTYIYSISGVADAINYNMSEEKLKNYIINAGFIPVERDSFYNPI